MRSVSGLIRRLRNLTPEFVMFALVGTVAFAIAEVGSNLLRFKVGLDPLTSNAVPTMVATVFAFVGNRYLTFRHRQRTSLGREGAMFLVLNLVGTAIQLACIGFTSYALGLNGKLAYNIALICGIGLAMLFRFWSYRKWVWHVQPIVPASSPIANAQVPA